MERRGVPERRIGTTSDNTSYPRIALTCPYRRFLLLHIDISVALTRIPFLSPNNVPALRLSASYTCSRGRGMKHVPVDDHLPATPHYHAASSRSIPDYSRLNSGALRSRPDAAVEAHLSDHRLADRSNAGGHCPAPRRFVTGGTKGAEVPGGEGLGDRPAESGRSRESLRRRPPPSPLGVRCRRSRTRALAGSEPRKASGALNIIRRKGISVDHLSTPRRRMRDVPRTRRVLEVLALTTLTHQIESLGSAARSHFLAMRSAHFTGRGMPPMVCGAMRGTRSKPHSPTLRRQNESHRAIGGLGTGFGR